MAENVVSTDADDFSAEMNRLIAEAEKAAAPSAGHDEKGPQHAAQAFEPLQQAIVALSRALLSNGEIIKRLDARCEEMEQTNKKLLASIEDKKGLTKSLFDAMHEEMKGYKDGFLFEALQKPFVRDLIGLYDDLIAAHAQTEDGSAARTQFDHLIHHVLELLSRLEVERMDACPGKHNRELQRAVKTERAETPEEDGDIVCSLRRGFNWRGRLVRPEEVVIRRFNSESR